MNEFISDEHKDLFPLDVNDVLVVFLVFLQHYPFVLLLSFMTCVQLEHTLVNHCVTNVRPFLHQLLVQLEVLVAVVS